MGQEPVSVTPKTRLTFSLVRLASSSSLMPYAWARRCSTLTTKAGSFRWPRWGTGAMYGESVSKTIRSIGTVVPAAPVVPVASVAPVVPAVSVAPDAPFAAAALPARVSGRWLFLKVSTPPMPSTNRGNCSSYCASISLRVKQWNTPPGSSSLYRLRIATISF